MTAKRAFDVVVAAALVLLLMPLLAAVAVVVYVTSPGGALFLQPRVGYLGQPFTMFKFRTMIDGAERQEQRLARTSHRTFMKLKQDPRTTRVGRFLRRYSLDELPQLFNVLRGDMSLVGPRPLLLSDLEKLPRHQQLPRFAMKPGITGLWQVSGRSHTSDEQRMRLDLAYVNHWSVWLDLKILARTIPVVLRAEGAI
ncbi:MAG TPA: sugar transferase [Vicinamibacterales bacterium]|nr:sugar transferase [Vicinamibacterales bacterium]